MIFKKNYEGVRNFVFLRSKLDNFQKTHYFFEGGIIRQGAKKIEYGINMIKNV